MQRTPVESSMIQSAGYDADARELEVAFNSGAVYRYQDVDEGVYEGLLEAESKGRYMHAHVLDLYSYYEVR